MDNTDDYVICVVSAESQANCTDHSQSEGWVVECVVEWVGGWVGGASLSIIQAADEARNARRGRDIWHIFP